MAANAAFGWPPSFVWLSAMQFIEMTGATLMRCIDGETITPEQLRTAGVNNDSLVRVNRQGDIELRRHDRWDVIGGLIGDYEHRVQRESGLTWA